jgi:hypothetical protein
MDIGTSTMGSNITIVTPRNGIRARVIQHYNRDTKKRHTRARDLERKLKLERIEACVNCQLLTECDKIGQFVDCECFVEIERDRAMIIVSLKEYSNRVEHR